MSSMEPGGIVQYEAGIKRRVFFVSVAVLVLAAAAAAIVAEPWLVFRRLQRATIENDVDALQGLLDPSVPVEQLRAALVLAQANPGMRLSYRYASPSRYLVVARARPGVATTGPVELAFVLERHGLSWWLADITPDDAVAIGNAPAPDPPEPVPVPPPADPGERMPEFGEYVYVEELPEAVERTPPVYPAPAREAGVEGTVMVQALIGRDGRVREARVQDSVPMLDAVALEAVRQWRFKPARAKGEPVAVWVAIPMRFTLR